jgi:hypothetical protein
MITAGREGLKKSLARYGMAGPWSSPDPELEQQPMCDDGTAAAVQALREQEFDGMESMAIAAYALDTFRDGCKPDEYGWPLGLPMPARDEESYESDGGTYIVLRNVNGILANRLRR